ncbi:MAG: hypothetical protein FJ217_07955 [Ignavibacteria bacterium]|nr:hypothetical protein [Ignavibacteria bacterium]
MQTTQAHRQRRWSCCRQGTELIPFLFW